MGTTVPTSPPEERVDVLKLLILILLLVAVIAVAFVLVQRKRRAGGVIASRPRRTRRGS